MLNNKQSKFHISLVDLADQVENTDPLVPSTSNMAQDPDENTAGKFLLASPNSSLLEDGLTLRDGLLQCLDLDWVGLKKTGLSTRPNPTNPGLRILDEETVGLPVSHREAKIIFDMSVALEVTENEGPKEKVRTAFTIPPSAIKFDNPAFPAWLNKVAGKVSTDLRIARRVNGGDSIRVKFQGLILQPPCASNEPLRLVPKTDNTIAVMVIVLPTTHTGGDIIFSSKSNDQLGPYETSSDSPFGCSVASWLFDPDFDVELGPIDSGCRVMLVYDLFATKKLCFPSAALTRNTEATIRQILLDLKQYPEVTGMVPGVFAHVLKHTGQIGGDVLDTLDWEDRSVVEAMSEICKEIGLFFYVASVQMRFDSQGLGEGATSADPRSVLLTEVSDLENSRIARMVNIETDNLVGNMTLGNGVWKIDRDQNGHEFFVYHGVAMLVVVPRCYTSLLLHPGNEHKLDVKHWINHITQHLEISSDEIALEQLRHACRYITAEHVAWEDGTGTTEYEKAPFGVEVMEDVIKASLVSGELDLSFNLEKLTWQSHIIIGEFIAKYGFQAVEKSLAVSVSKLQHISNRRNLLNELETTVQAAIGVENSPISAYMWKWRKNQAEVCLRECVLKTGEDAHGLVQMAGRYGSDFLVSSIVETVRLRSKRTSFVLYFLNHLATDSTTVNLPGDAVKTCYKILLPAILPNLWLRGHVRENRQIAASNISAPGPLWGQIAASKVSVPDPNQQPIWRLIADLIRNCIYIKADDELATLVKQILVEGCNWNTDYGTDYEEIYVPFLTYLYEGVKELQITLSKGWKYRENDRKLLENDQLQTLFLKLIGNHLRIIRQPNPPLLPHPTNWVKPKKGCGDVDCRDCTKLDRFLQDPDKKYGRFKVHTQRRKHLEEQFGGLTEEKQTYQGYTGRGYTDRDYRFRYIETPYPGILMIGKSHEVFERQMETWSRNSRRSLDLIDRSLVSRGASNMLGNRMGRMADIRTMIDLKVAISQDYVDLCNRMAEVGLDR